MQLRPQHGSIGRRSYPGMPTSSARVVAGPLFQARTPSHTPARVSSHALLSKRPQRTAVRPMASAASLSAPYVYPKDGNEALQKFPAVAPLPPPPAGAKLGEVLPYLAKLAMGERTLLWRLAIAFVCMVASKAAGLSGPLFLKHAVDAMTAAVDPLMHAVRAIVCFGLCGVLGALAKELQHPMFTPVSQAVARRVAYHTFAHVLDLDIKFHLERRTGRLSRILERGTRSIQMLYRALLFTFAPTCIELVFVCALLGTVFSPVVAGLVGVTFATYVIWTLSLTQAAVEVRKQVNTLDNLTTSKAVDALLNAETVALFDNRALEVDQYDHYLKGFQRAAIQTERLSATLNAGQSVVLSLGLTMVLIAAVVSGPGGAAAAANVAAGRPGATAGDLVMIQGLLLQLWAPLQFLGWFYRELRQSLVDMEEFFEILQTRTELPDGTIPLPATPPSVAAAAATAAAATANGSSPAAVASHANGNGAARGALSSHDEAPSVSGRGLEVEITDVSFGYQPERQVLRGVTLRAAPGKSLAVVGSSGSGKSTILKLVTRLYDVGGGSIKVNGVDVRDLQRSTLRSSVAVVPQDTVLFNDTILQNIRYGRPDASDEEVIRAAQMAHLHEAVIRMPDGYHTMVGERGLKLSGGEKQRVAIARAFLRAPQLLICDEATSALDTATEASILASLDELAQGRTSIFVAHRLSTIRGCDRIVVLSNGLVAEEGTHAELMAKQGIYADMWEMQAAEEALPSGQGVETSEEEESPALVEPLPALTTSSMG